MKCISCGTDSLVFQEHKDKATGMRSNYWWCNECNKRSQPATPPEPKREIEDNAIHGLYGAGDIPALPEGFRNK